MSLGRASVEERWVVVCRRTAAVSPSCRVRAAWLISGFKYAYCYGKTPWVRAIPFCVSF